MSKPVRYSDINSSFSPHPITKDLTPVLNEESIKQALRNLIFTNYGEVFYDPMRGSDIRALLFELALDDIDIILEDQLKTTINNYEPRVNVIKVSSRVMPDQNSLSVSIVFAIINNPLPVVLDILLDRVR